MKIGLLGSGGREHAIARGLCQDENVRLYTAAPNINPGIHDLSEDYHLTRLEDLQNIKAYFKSQSVDLVVVGPEKPLIAGIVDQIRESGIPILGPTGSQARLEGDKSFMRRLLNEDVGWGSPIWEKITSLSEAKEFIDQVGAVVVKPLGLTGGKGVRVAGTQLEDREETLSYIQSLLKADGAVLLEEQVIGEEFSRMAFVSDGVILPTPCMQDFKYAYDGDQGLMTGGMGAYSMDDGGLPFLQQKDYKLADQLLNETIHALEEKTDAPYRGFLYGQFMATHDGIRLIEYNVRLGDPEALNLMSLLDVPAAGLFYAIASGELSKEEVSFKKQASVSKYLVPQAYPDPIGEPVEFSFDPALVKQSGLSVIYGSVERKDAEKWLTLGSRTLGIVGLGEEPGKVSDQIEAFLMNTKIPELRHRKDVGDHDVIQQKAAKMKRIRGDT
jgi:phosphoribosylamine---glycine ligase